MSMRPGSELRQILFNESNTKQKQTNNNVKKNDYMSVRIYEAR